MSLDHSARRIACLQPSATAILASLGELNRIVACTKYCVDICPEVVSGGRTIVADSWTAKSEEIIAARPDLVIASVPYQEKAISEILRAGIRFLGFSPKTLGDVYGDTAIIAGIVGRDHEGNRLIEGMKGEIEAIRTKTSAMPCLRVFCEEWGKPLIQSQPWVAELVRAAGGEFVGAPGKQILPADALSENPEVIVAAWCGAGDRVPLRKIIQQRGWGETLAAQQNRVYCIRDEFLNTPSPTLIKGLHALAAAIHPECFPHADGLRCITAEDAAGGKH